jgi:post-segregation antitoxin (ccd killing protein)
MKRCLVQNAKDFWRIENAEAIAEQNEDVAKHGLPFAKYRQF